jgi:tetratricopeptide (TPR) repeat protein
LKYIDLNTTEPENAWRVNEQYDYFAEDLLSDAKPGKLTEFINALVNFLNRSGWQSRVKEARQRLDNLSPEGETLILGEILTAGSLSVLESLHLSQEYADQGKFDSAVEEAYRAIQLSPHYLAGHIQLAELMVKQERTEIAVNKYLTIGDTYRVRGDPSGAINNYERAVELSPMDLVNRARLIEILIQQGRIDRALEHYVVMGEAYYNLAEVEKARETYLTALRLAPKGSAEKNWRSRLLRAIADIDMQRLDWKRALAAYNELSTKDPDDDRIVLTLVDLYYKVDQPISALRQLDRYLVRLVRRGQGEKIESILEDLVERHPNDAGLADRLTRLYIRQRREQEAIKLLDKLGEAQLDAGETQQAIETIHRILQLNPPNETSYRQLLHRLRQGAT